MQGILIYRMCVCVNKWILLIMPSHNEGGGVGGDGSRDRGG